MRNMGKMESFTGTCSYCGQTKIVMAESQKDANERVTLDCSCPEIHARLHANADNWARIENLKWKMYYQNMYEQRLMGIGMDRKEARKPWMAMIGKNYLPQI